MLFIKGKEMPTSLTIFDIIYFMKKYSSKKMQNPVNMYQARIFALVNKREDAYCCLLKGLSKDSQVLFLLKKRLNKEFLRWTRLITSFQRLRFFQTEEMQSFLKKYLISIKEIHQTNCAWISIYCDLLWPSEIHGSAKYRKKWQHFYKDNHMEAERMWARLEKQSQSKSPFSKRQDKIARLKTKMSLVPINSAPWRAAFHNLTKMIYDMVSFQCQTSSYSINGKFQLSLSAQTIISQTKTGPAQNNASEIHTQERVMDWLKGYVPHRKGYAHVVLNKMKASLNKAYLSWNFFQGIKKIGMISIIVSGILLFNYSLTLTQWDNRLLQRAEFQIKRLFQQDPLSIAKRKKKEILLNRIINIENDHSADDIREKIGFFYESGLHTKKEGYLYFANNILEGFFLLLSDWDLNDDLKDDVLSAAQNFDPALAESLENIITLYEAPVMHEKDLRKNMLNLRGVLLQNKVMPFMFLALKNDIPYLFLFSEKIIRRYSLKDTAVQKLDLKGDYYKNRIYCFLVEGDAYPFSDRAGYFEGQFAVTFRKFSANYQWTVYHEIGHVIDFLRKRFEGKPLPKNIELHSMLSPLIWSDERKDYLAQRLVREALHGDVDNYYSQAAKGILNGLLMQLKESDPKIIDPLITNRFERDRIERIYEHLRPIDTLDLKAMVYNLYAEEEKYLSSAQAGLYAPYVSNVEEIIYGTDHPVAQQGFLLRGTSLGGLRNGPRFIRDNNSDIPFNIFAFLRSVFYVIFMGKRSFSQATQAEAFVAAIFVFILFNGLMFFLQTIAAPYRKKIFYGAPLDQLINNIYQNNPWSNGLSYGKELNERVLLKKIFQTKGDINDNLKEDVAKFKSIADENQRFLFDLCLLLAPFNPDKSFIKNKAHDLLFFLPFLGPYLGRATWIWPVQRFFHTREEYNKNLTLIAYDIKANTVITELFSKVLKLIKRYVTQSSPQPQLELKADHNFDVIKEYVTQSFAKGGLTFHTNVKFLEDRFTLFQEASQEFDRLDRYTPGDDIRRIDWRATLKSPLQEPYVRRYNYPYGIKIGLWLDMRHIHTTEGQKQWAEDFVRAMNMITEDGLLERFIFIMPNGYSHESVVNLRIYRKHDQMTEKILKKAKDCYWKLEHQALHMDIKGFNFYSLAENKKFLNIIALTDFGKGAQDIQWKRLHAKRLNIFIIGAMIDDKLHIETLLGETNKMFFVRVQENSSLRSS